MYRQLVLLGDQHLGIYSNSREWLALMLAYYREVFLPELLRRYPTEADRVGVAVVLYGDLFNAKEHTDTFVRNAACDLLEEITAYFEVLMLVGNHDTPLLTNIRVNSVREFRYMPRVQVFDSAREIELCTGETMLMQPWSNSKDQLVAELRAASERCQFCSAHNSVEGFHYQGKAVEGGGKYPRLDDYDRFTGGTFLGHIHKQQQLRNTRYIGSPYQTSFGEVGYPVGYSILDIASRALEFVENTFSPRFKVVPYLQLLQLPFSEAQEVVRNNFVHVLLPTRLPYKLNPGKLNQILSGYRLLEVKTVAEAIQKVDSEGDPVPAQPLDSSVQIDVRAKLTDYLGSVETVRLGKTVLVLQAETRRSVGLLLDDLYKEAEQTLLAVAD